MHGEKKAHLNLVPSFSLQTTILPQILLKVCLAMKQQCQWRTCLRLNMSHAMCEENTVKSKYIFPLCVILQSSCNLVKLWKKKLKKIFNCAYLWNDVIQAIAGHQGKILSNYAKRWMKNIYLIMFIYKILHMKLAFASPSSKM